MTSLLFLRSQTSGKSATLPPSKADIFSKREQIIVNANDRT
jgi:hypothetical protein